MDFLTANAKVIKTAARNAILAWTVLYLAMFVTLLGYRFSTRQYYLAQTAKAQKEYGEVLRMGAEDAAGAATPTTMMANRVIRQVRKEDPLEPYRQEMVRLVEELTAAQHDLWAKREVIESNLDRLQAIEDSPVWSYDLSLVAASAPTAPAASDDIEYLPSLTESWNRLMSVPSLSALPDDALESTFGHAVEEILTILRGPPGDWTPIHDLFFGEDSTAVVKEPRQFVCPNALAEDDDDGDGVQASDGRWQEQIDPNAASIRDLEDRQIQVEQLLSRRVAGAGVSALMPDTQAQLEETFQEAIHELFEEIQQVVGTLEKEIHRANSGNSLGTSSCFDPGFVTALVEAGLLAMSAHADVREALRKATLELDPNTSEESLILDADLPLPSSSGAGGLGSSTNKAGTVINLRSVLDSPLLTQSARWVDQLVELCGGYNDVVDRYFDSITTGRGDGDLSVGEVAVESLLAQAGRVGDIDVQKVAQKIAEKLPPTVRQQVLERL